MLFKFYISVSVLKSMETKFSKSSNGITTLSLVPAEQKSYNFACLVKARNLKSAMARLYRQKIEIEEHEYRFQDVKRLFKVKIDNVYVSHPNNPGLFCECSS